jgi:5S rRNA maturation endonuclease (ribonuclease M5)
MKQLRYKKAKFLAEKYDLMILKSLGFDIGSDKKIICACPIHNGDNPTGFKYDSSMKIWKCWTHGCDKEYGCGVLGLVQSRLRCTLEEALEYVENILDSKNVNILSLDIDRESFINTQTRKKVKSKTFFDINKISTNSKCDYFVKRGINASILASYYAFECDNNSHFLHGRACLSILDDDDNIVGFTGRAIGNIEPKWLHFPKSLETSKVLFGLNQCKNSIKDNKYVLLVEGPLDVLKLKQLGINNSVSMLGTNFSKEHVKLLLKYNVISLILYLDPDKSGRIHTDKIEQKYKNIFKIYDIYKFVDVSVEPGDLECNNVNTIKDFIESIKNDMAFYLCK